MRAPEVGVRLKLLERVIERDLPGCGKTFLARKLAEIVKFTFIEVPPADLASIYVHGGQQKIHELFTKAREQAPTLLFLDEIDALVARRDQVGHHDASEVNEFLAQLNECARHRVLVVGATNLPELIDPAILRPGRFDTHVYVGPPDLEARVQSFRLCLADRPQRGIDHLALAQASDGFTPAEIRFVVDEAARAAVEERRTVSQEDVVAAIRGHPASSRKRPIPKRIGF
jgi:transitional endoplasmic reticulum ATPase